MKKKIVSQSTIQKSVVPSQSSKPLDFTKNFRIQFLCDGVREFKIDALNYLAELLIAWVYSRPDIYLIGEFISLQHLTNFNDLCARCPKLEEARKLAFEVIAFNRERRALESNPDGVAFKHMQGYYSKSWQDRQDIQDKKVSENSTKFIVMENFGEIKES